MNFRRFACTLGLLVAFGLGTLVQAADPTPSTVWMTDFSKAQAEAKRLHRPMVVHFHTTWCQPCRKMEKEILHTPQVLKLLDQGFIAVKVDLDKPANGKLQSQFHIENMPTDILLSHDGKVLSRSEGYQGGADRQKYLAALNRADATYATEGKRLDRSEGVASTTEQPTKLPETPAAVASTPKGNGTPGNKLVPEPVEPYTTAEPARPTATESAPTVAREAVQPVVALDGYCPVTLRSTRTWKQGNKQFSVEHDGQLFLFTGAESRDEFKNNPDRYAPRLLGCDPVVLAENDLAIRGSTKFGAFYEGELFLFENAESRVKFRKDPPRYVRMKHALKPEDIKDVRRVAVTVTK